MGGYIRIDKDLADDPRCAPIVETLLDEWVAEGLPAVCRERFAGHARHTVTGILQSLWRYADTYLRANDTLKVSVTELARVTGTSAAVLRSLPSDWLVVVDKKTIRLPGYAVKNSLQDKDERREQNRVRKQRQRARERGEEPNTVTQKSRRDTSRNGHAGHSSLPVPDRTVPPNRSGPGEARPKAAAQPKTRKEPVHGTGAPAPSTLLHSIALPEPVSKKAKAKNGGDSKPLEPESVRLDKARQVRKADPSFPLAKLALMFHFAEDVLRAGLGLNGPEPAHG